MTTQRGTASNRALTIALLATVGGLGYANWQLWGHSPDISAITAAASTTKAPTAFAIDEASLMPIPRSAAEFPQTRGRPIFFASRRPIDRTPPKVVAAAPVVKAAPITPTYPLEQLQLVGIVRTGPKAARALIRAGTDGQGNWLGVGEQVRGWKLQEISDDIAVLESNGQRGEVKLYAVVAVKTR